MIAKQRDRKCASCRFYESSPLWRKGWCRNPLLFDPQTNHLVEADRLSCSRTFIDYWEPREGSRRARQQAASGEQPTHNPRVAPSIPMTPTGPGGTELRSSLSPTALPRERLPQLSLVRPDEKTGALPAEGESKTQELTEEVPVIAPLATPVTAPVETKPVAKPQTLVDRLGGQNRVLIIAALAVLLVLAAIPFILPTLTPAAVATPTRTSTISGGLVPTSTRTIAVPVIPPTEIVVPPTETPVVDLPLALRIGATAVVSGLNGQNLRVRQGPGTSFNISNTLQEGARVTIKDGPREADGSQWWDVTGWDNNGSSGWVSGQFLTPVQP